MPASEGGRVEDHVHLLCHFGRTITQAEWVKTGLKPTKMPSQLKQTVLFRCRVKKPLLDKANKVTRDLGTSTPEMVRIFLTQIAKTGKVPLKLDPEEVTEDPIAGPLE